MTITKHTHVITSYSIHYTKLYDGVLSDDRTGRIIVVSVIDNLVKGAAGQAVQNMNIMLGFDETLGLETLPLFP